MAAGTMILPEPMLTAGCASRRPPQRGRSARDDYITKPFRPRELIARLLANLRRADPGHQQPHIKLHGLEIDLTARAVHRDGETVHLTPIEYKFLAALTHNR